MIGILKGLNDAIKPILLDGMLVKERLFKKDKLENVINNKNHPERYSSNFLLSLLTFEYWYKTMSNKFGKMAF